MFHAASESGTCIQMQLLVEEQKESQPGAGCAPAPITLVIKVSRPSIAMLLKLRFGTPMQFPFDLDLPIFLYTIAHMVFRGVSVLRQSQNERAIPVHVESQEIPASALTPDQAQYLARWDKKLEALNYQPVCTYRTVIFGHNLQRAYISPGDKARCTVMIIELKVSGKLENVAHSCSLRFVTDYADGRRLITHNTKVKALTDKPPGFIVQKCPNVNNVAELKRRHDRRAATLGEAAWPPADAKSIFELDDRRRKAFNQYQLERGTQKLTPAGDAYIQTDQAYWRAIRNHYNPFAQRFHLARLLPAILTGACLPLLSLWKLAPAAGRLVPILGVEEAINVAAYLAAGAIIGYILDRSSFVWTFLITYIAAHAVMGWSFGPVPYSILAGLASFYVRRATHRRRLILMEA